GKCSVSREGKQCHAYESAEPDRKPRSRILPPHHAEKDLGKKCESGADDDPIDRPAHQVSRQRFDRHKFTLSIPYCAEPARAAVSIPRNRCLHPEECSKQVTHANSGRSGSPSFESQNEWLRAAPQSACRRGPGPPCCVSHSLSFQGCESWSEPSCRQVRDGWAAPPEFPVP